MSRIQALVCFVPIVILVWAGIVRAGEVEILRFAQDDVAETRGEGRSQEWEESVRCGRLDEAVALLRERVDEPGGDEAVVALARLYEQLGEIEAAIEMYQRAVVIPGLPEHRAVELGYRLDHCKRQRASLVRFPYSVEALTEIRQVDALLETRQWHAAFNTMAGILERFEGQFLQQATGESQGLWGWAREKLGSIPPAGKEAFAAWSRTAWEAALEEGSYQAVRSFLTAHPAREVGGAAFVTWAKILADQGEFARAAGLLSRGDVDGEKAAELMAEWQRWYSPEGSAADDVRSDLSADALKALLVDGSKGLRIANRPGENADEWGWASDAGRLFVARHFRVEAYDLRAGKALWTYTFDRGGDRYLVRRDIYDYHRVPRHKWTGAVDRPGIVVCPAGVLVVHAHHFGDPAAVFRTLTCLDPATGDPVWQLERDPFFDNLRVCSDPVYLGGKVLLVASSRGRFPSYWLCALDGEDGRLLWRHHIAIGATPTDCIGRGVLYAGQSGPTVTVDGETVYYTTHMGAVVAVDRDLGQPLWAVSYPRIARYGPVRRGPLPLLERRTEPIFLTSKYLVLLPRDLNGVLVIDREAGKIVTILRSLDLLELIDATDEFVIVRTLAGEVRRVRMADGREEWRWRPESEVFKRSQLTNDSRAEKVECPLFSRPVRLGDELVVAGGDWLTTVDVATGAAERVEAPEGLEFYRTSPGGHWVAITPEGMRVVTGSDGECPRAEPGTVIADGNRSRQSTWIHEAYVPGLEVRGRLVASSLGTMLLVADQTGLSVFRLANERDADGRHGSQSRGTPAGEASGRHGSQSRGTPGRAERLWRRDFLSEQTCWGVSFGSTLSYQRLHRVAPQPETVPTDIVAWCDDGVTVRVLDMATGQELGAGYVEGVGPVQRVHVVGDKVLVESFAQLAWIRAEGDGSLATLWQRDFGPSIFEGVYPGDPETLVFVQGMDHVAAKVLRLRHDDMTQPVAAEFDLPSPDLSVRIFDEENRPERYPVHRLSYTQDEVRGDTDGLTMTREGETVDLSGMAIMLLALSERYPEHALLELGEYHATVSLTDGEVTMVSPFVTDNASLKNKTPEEDLLFQWYREVCERRDCTPDWRSMTEAPFYFASPEFAYGHEFCLMGGQHVRPKCAVLKHRETGEVLSLGHPNDNGLGGDEVEPDRIDRVGSRWMISASTGALVLRRLQENVSVDSVPGKPAEDLMTAPAVTRFMDFTPVLDGDLSEWPSQAWQEMRPSVHGWPRAARGEDSNDATVRASFATALDDEAKWVAVRVEDDRHVAPSASPALMGDQVEILVTGRLGLLRNPAWPREDPVPLVVTLSLADHFPIGWCRARYYPTTLAQPVGAGARFGEWFRRRYGAEPEMDEYVMVAGRRDGDTSTFEVRIDRALFQDNTPGAFDIRVGDNDGNGLHTWLDWGGALNRERVYPVAVYTLPEGSKETD